MKKLFIAALFALVSAFGTFGGAVCHAAANDAVIGFINFDAVLQACPGFEDAQNKLQKEQKRLQTQYDNAAADLDEAGRLELSQKLNAELAKIDADTLKPIQDKITNAIKAAAEKNGIKQVVRMEVILYGGLDLTNAVIDNLKK